MSLNIDGSLVNSWYRNGFAKPIRWPPLPVLNVSASAVNAAISGAAAEVPPMTFQPVKQLATVQ